jgi:hypothetical protein
MANYFLLELDTTPPTAEIYTSNYTTKTNKTQISIVANEKLSSLSEVYFIDSNGDRHDTNFLLDNIELVGEMYFSDYPFGVTEIHVILCDDVGNVSGIFKKSFNIVESISQIKTVQIEETLSNKAIVEESNLFNIKIEINKQKVRIELFSHV